MTKRQEKPAAKAPDKLAEVDLLRTQLAAERVSRQEAEVRVALAALAKARLDNDAFGMDLRARYDIQATDSVQADGKIVRGPRATEVSPAKPTAEATASEASK